MIGQQIQQFKITEKLGAGGMGEVFIAEDTRLHRRVALKFLPPHYSADPEFKSRFEHEARAAAALNHPNIITVHDLGEHDGRLYIVLELVEGQSLDALIKAGTLTVPKSVEFILQVCEGLRVAHEAGIVHRDIKPANILIDKNGRVKILDFGLAKSRRATTETRVGTTVGTIQYESPEQGRGDSVDQRSDLFSVGVLLYEMLTGHLPFKGEFDDAIRYAIANEEPEPLARYKAGVPDELQRIVHKLLEKDPELRYQTASGVLPDLKLLQRTSGPRPSGIRSGVSSVTPGPTSSALHSPAPPAVSSVPSAPRKRRLLPILVPSTVAVIAVVLALVFKPWKLEVSPTQEAAAGEERIAVMYFDNLAEPDDPRRQGEVIASLLISDLSQSQYLQVVSSQHLYDILKQLGKEDTKTITSDVATQVARKANARWMLTGRIIEAGPEWVVQAELSEVGGGSVIASPTIRGKPGEKVYDVVDQLTAGIKRDLALPGAALAETDTKVADLTTSSTDAYELYVKAENLTRRFDYFEAEPLLLKAVALDSTFAMAYYQLSQVRIVVRDDFPMALEYITDAYRHREKASEHDRLLIESAYLSYTERPQESVAILQRLVERFPDDKYAYKLLGERFQYQAGIRDIPRAIEMYTRAVELDPSFAGAYNDLAYAYDRMGNYEKSIWAINKYIETQPNSANPYDSRAELYANRGQLERALASYLEAIRIDSGFIVSVKGAVSMCMFLGRYEQAFALCDALARRPNPEERAQGEILMARLALYRGQIRKATLMLEKGLKQDSQNGAGMSEVDEKLLLLAQALGLAGREKDQMARLHELDALLEPNDPTGALRDGFMGAVAWLLWQEQKPHLLDSLVGVYRRHRDRFALSDSLNAHGVLAAWAMTQGDYPAAIRHLEAKAGDRLWFPDLYALGLASAGADRQRDALRYFEEALDVYDKSRWSMPVESALLHYHLGNAYEKSGQQDKAKAEYQALVSIWSDADTELPELVDARKRLARLGA